MSRWSLLNLSGVLQRSFPLAGNIGAVRTRNHGHVGGWSLNSGGSYRGSQAFPHQAALGCSLAPTASIPLSENLRNAFINQYHTYRLLYCLR